MDTSKLEFRSWGFDLFLPPTPIAVPPEPARFIMLDDMNEKFYDIDYETALLGNNTPWTELALHKVQGTAIVFPPEQQDMLHKMSFATGLLVAIESRDEDIVTARKLGRVNVRPLPKEVMSWAALRAIKGPELVAEMRAGLLRHLWGRRFGATDQPIAYVTPGRILNSMSRPWLNDGAALNYELDSRFVAGQTIGPPSRWRITGLSSEEIVRSRTRAELYVVN